MLDQNRFSEHLKNKMKPEKQKLEELLDFLKIFSRRLTGCHLRRELHLTQSGWRGTMILSFASGGKIWGDQSELEDSGRWWEERLPLLFSSSKAVLEGVLDERRDALEMEF